MTVALVACGTTAPLTTTVSSPEGGGDRVEQEASGSGAATTAETGEPGADPAASGAATSPTAGSTPRRAGGSAGSASGGGATSGSGGGAAAGTPGASAGTAAAPTGPIKVGVLIHDFTALVKSVGGSGSQTDAGALARALIKGINARGGLAGRQIEPVFYTVDGSASDYSSQYQAACDKFTRDDRVEVIVGGGASDLFYSCVLKADLAVLAGNPTEGTDREGMGAFPNVFNPPGMATDRQAAALIAQSVSTGWLSSKNRLGVLVSGCQWGPRVYNGVIVPAAKKHGIAVEQFALPCPTPGSAALSAYSGAIQSAALQFRQNGVDRVMFAVGHGDAASYVFFTRNADSQQWYPGYMAGTNAVVQGWTSSGVVSRAQAVNTRGMGWVPVVDSATPVETDATRACIDIAKAGGAPQPPDQATAGNYYMLCDAFLPLRAAVEATGGAANFTALRPALEGLGTSYAAAAVVGSATQLGRDRHDGAGSAAFFAYVAECSCFRYTGNPEPA